MAQPPYTRPALVINAAKPGAAALGAELRRLAQARGAVVRLTTRFPLPRGFLRGCDLVAVIGGDGTLLGVVQEAARAGLPVVGINQGSLGFLTTFTAEEARQAFPAILDGCFRLSERGLLEARLPSGAHGLALNDLVIKDRNNLRMLRLEVSADGEVVTEYYCDGLIVCSPTGSTAYNLSAGGPIMHPESGTMGMTPICPHTLSNRTVVFRDTVHLRIVNRTPGVSVQVALDGQRFHLARTGAAIEVKGAVVKLRLAQQPDYSHFAVVRTKLQWHGLHLRRRAARGDDPVSA